jgi:hypothetical protein
LPLSIFFFLNMNFFEFLSYDSYIFIIKIIIRRVVMFFLIRFNCNELTFLFMRQCRFIYLQWTYLSFYGLTGSSTHIVLRFLLPLMAVTFGPNLSGKDLRIFFTIHASSTLSSRLNLEFIMSLSLT